MCLANKTLMPKLGYFFLANVIVLGLRSAYPNLVESLTIYKRGLPPHSFVGKHSSSPEVLGMWVVFPDARDMGRSPRSSVCGEWFL